MLLSAGRALARRVLQQHAAAAAAPSSSSAGWVRQMGGGAHDDDHHDEPHYESTPTVFDKLVKLNVVDLNGKSHTVQGLVGEPLSQTLVQAGFPAVSRCRAARARDSPHARALRLGGHRAGGRAARRPPTWCAISHPRAELLLPQHGLLHAARGACCSGESVMAVMMRELLRCGWGQRRARALWSAEAAHELL